MRLGPIIAAGTRSNVHVCEPSRVAKVPLESTPDRWIRDEAAFTRAVRAAGAPAPDVIDVVVHDGRPVVVYERIDGPSLWSVILDDRSRAEEYGALLAGLHADVLALDGPVVLPRQRDRLAGKVQRAARITGLDTVAALDLIPTGDATHRMCHGDLHPANVLMSSNGPVLVDWFDTCRGAAIGDVARTSLLLGAGGVTTAPHLPGSGPADGDVLPALHRGYLDAITDRLGFSDDDFRAWRRVEAAARLAEHATPNPDLIRIWLDRL